MLIYRYIAVVLACCTIFATQCLGFIFTVSCHYRTDDIPTELENWGDNHHQRTKEENFEQLKMFIRHYLLKDRVHLIIESNFFYGVDYKNTNIKSYLEALSKHLNPGFFPWSFYNSPQDPTQTTCIAWELPFIILSVFSYEDLPEGFELNQQEREQIINNVTVEFRDPRGQLSEDVISGHVKFNFNQANKSSPEKTSKILADYVEARFSNATVNTTEMTYLAHAFDIEALSSIINCLSSHNPVKKIVVLSGDWHRLQLDNIVPLLGFTNKRQFEFTENKVQPQAAENKVQRKLNFGY